MKRKTCKQLKMLAVAMAMGVCSVANAQQKSNDIDWTKDFTSRITLNGYAQGGWSYQDPNGKPQNAYNLKRTLLWAKARITDRWSFMFMHDFSSVVQEFYTDYRLSKGNEMTVRLGQFKHSYSMENPMSPTQLELVDVYSQAVLYLAGEGPDPLNGVNYGRDMGLEVYGDLAKGLLHYELALMSGQGINRDKGQRLFCGCIVSKDIGEYNTCPHLCEYCYANSSKEIAVRNWKEHKKNQFGETIKG